MIISSDAAAVTHELQAASGHPYPHAIGVRVWKHSRKSRVSMHHRQFPTRPEQPVHAELSL